MLQPKFISLARQTMCEILTAYIVSHSACKSIKCVLRLTAYGFLMFHHIIFFLALVCALKDIEAAEVN